jgi:hypothetical protein
MWKYVLAWFPMVAIAIINGMLREAWYGKHLGELQAHQVSTFTAVVLFGHYVAGHSRGRLLHDYNLFAGRVWLILLVWVTVAPYLFFRLRG